MEKATITTLVLILLACVLPLAQGRLTEETSDSRLKQIQIEQLKKAKEAKDKAAKEKSKRAKYERTVQLTSPMSPGSTFAAQTHNGSITIKGDEVTDCNLVATIITQAPTEKEARELSDQVKVTLVPSDQRLTLKIDKPEQLINKSVSVTLDVKVPNKTSLELLTHNGTVKITDTTGRLNATTHNGKVIAQNISGTILLRTHNGSVDCRDISGDAKLLTHNGGIEAVYSQNAPPACHVSLVTHNGAVGFTAPPGVSAKVDASTHNGSIRTDLPITATGKKSKTKLTGTIGTGEGNMHLETHNGSIQIR
ncbi:MAG: hypothetical protein JXM79_22510 [Sedimentisphaerales bacterium]|nr:hypothetical protein [Sedimentisphaerales bacterium]